ncbi:phage tail protein [Acinetobacter sp. UGAL515B_02]|nr:phage tail protein [Acinetobacter sp. UGAL515B_02]WON79096.1 phage tail protein [Acinetobacter sp. UGAL515B_02]
MTKQAINIGNAANDGKGEPARSAFNKVNSNFTEVYNALGGSSGTIPSVLPIANGGTGNSTLAGLRETLNINPPSNFQSANVAKSLACVAALNVTANDTTAYNTFLSSIGGLGIPAIGSVNLATNTDGSSPPSTGWTTFISVRHRGGVGDGSGYGFVLLDRGMQTNIPQLYVQKQSGSNWGVPAKIYHSANTTVDSNGFIKAASPIVQLYSDKIELNDEAKEQSIKFERVDVGHYLVKGSSGFATEGWYIEQPKDANGNLYHVVEIATHENGDLDIKTYDYMLDKKGRIVADHDTPLDIYEGRWIDIRLQEVPKPVPEMPTEEVNSDEPQQ